VRGAPVLLLLLAAACWGVGTVVSKQAVAEIPPLTLLAVQLVASVAFLGVLALARGGWPRPASRETVLLGRLGLLNPGLAYALSLIGLTQITASLSVLLWATEPILILALAAVVLGERLGAGILAASGLAVAGLALVVLDPAASGSVLGVGLTVAGVAVCAAYSVATRRWLPGTSDSTLNVVLSQQLHALAIAVAVVVILAATGGTVVPAIVSGGGAVSAVASGLLYYAVAYLAYLGALRTMPVSVAASTFYLIPLFGVAAAAVAGERLQPLQWLGAVLVVLAVAAITARGARRGGAAGDQPSSASASAQIATTPRPASRS
jgi:drug/metabolite transporter (DMT)-like permease